MIVEFDPEERDLLLQLVDVALHEIGPEIRHTMTSTYKDELKAQRRLLRRIHGLLAAMPPQVPTSAEGVSAAGLIGTP